MNVGILGAGQLGRMLALAGYPLGLRFRFLDPDRAAPAGRLADLVVGDYEDADALRRFADGLDVATYEFENVPATVADLLDGRVPAVHPHYAALAAAQDRLVEKTTFRRLGIPTAPFEPIDSRDDLVRAVDALALPAVLKTRRLGYDGKGQFVLRDAADVDRAWTALGGSPLILEGFVAFERELSILAVRGRDGDVAFYPLVENVHREGILRRSIAPAPGVPPALQSRAEAYARAVLEAFDYVGVLAIELFQRGDELLASEMAPRVHNSGHWTIEGAETSQFENHLRAICGMPLGSTALRGPTAMLNIIGTIPDRDAILAVPGAHLHLYDKTPRPGRKLGHITVRERDLAAVSAHLAAIEALVEAPGAHETPGRRP
ncbi:MAG TPA: 5-(carboxyamino)imidazole ribonucleotide synthase [Longimicrobiales bacterium]